TRHRYYGVPIIRDGKAVVFEISDDSQVISKYVDDKLGLGLFPWELEGVQSILWRYIENEIEGVGFRLNDVYWRELVPESDRLRFLRHKDRKFGRGCINQAKACTCPMVGICALLFIGARLGTTGTPYSQLTQSTTVFSAWPSASKRRIPKAKLFSSVRILTCASRLMRLDYSQRITKTTGFSLRTFT